MLDWINIAGDLFSQSNSRILWNLFLAFIPCFLSLWLFRPLAHFPLIWWIVLLIFLGFLPNAPYILTDTIHIWEIGRQNYPLSTIILVLIPQYSAFIWLGFQAYTIALMRWHNYLIYVGKQHYTIAIELGVHWLCVIGMYLGRFERFNSWDLLTRPQFIIAKTLDNLLNVWNLLTLTLSFFILWGLFSLVKSLNSSIIAKISAIQNCDRFKKI